MSIASLDRKESADYSLLVSIENPSKLYYQSIIVNVISLGILLKTKEERTVVQFHFREWPDHGAPEHISLITFQAHVRREKSRMVGKILVHCRYVKKV